MFETEYLKLGRGAQLVDPISVYLFILTSEIFILNAKNNLKIEGINIFKHKFFCNVYTDDINFFLKDKIL